MSQKRSASAAALATDGSRKRRKGSGSGAMQDLPTTSSSQQDQEDLAPVHQPLATQLDPTPAPAAQLSDQAPALVIAIVSAVSTDVTHPTAPALPISADTDPCPIDWDHEGLQGIPPACKKAYELRALWKGKPGMSLRKISEDLNQEFGENLSDEAWRKRIMSVTKTVYLATGMWWAHGTAHKGLENIFPLTGNAGSYHAPSSIAQAPGSGDASLANTYGVTNTNATTERDEQRSRTNDNDKKKPPRYKGPVFTMYGKDSKDWAGFKRVMPLEKASESSDIFNFLIEEGDMVYPGFLNTSQRVLDLFLSCFAPEDQVSIPSVGFELIHWGSSNKFRYMEFPLEVTMSDLFQLLILAADLKSRKVVKMVLNTWQQILINERQIRKEYQTGARLMSDPPISFPRLLDFSPHDINGLFKCSMVDQEYPAARLFWLDVLKSYGNTGFEKILDSLGEYCLEFLEGWDPYLTQEQVDKLRERQNEITAHGMDLTRATNNGEISEDSDSDTDSESESDSDTEEVVSGSIVSGQNYEWKHMCRPDEKTQASIASQRLALLLAGDEKFCWMYHASADEQYGCRGLCSLPASATMTPASMTPSIKSQCNHVRLTINDIPGFTVQNQTGHSHSDFEKLFDSVKWDHPGRIRSVHLYEKDVNHIVYSSVVDKNLIPGAVYFPAGLEDEMGRWPSHPGYRRLDWNLQNSLNRNPQTKFSLIRMRI